MYRKEDEYVKGWGRGDWVGCGEGGDRGCVRICGEEDGEGEN